MSSAGLAVSRIDESVFSPRYLNSALDLRADESIMINLSVAGNMIPMRILGSDSIQSVKLRIQTFKGFVVKNQKLVCGGRELSRSNSLIRDYGVSHGNILHLVLKLSDLQEIKVKTVCGKELTFHVERCRNVGYVKKQIAKKGNGLLDAEDPELICDGEPLEDEKRIVDICKSNDAVMHLLVRKSAKIRARPIEKNFELSIDASHLHSQSYAGVADLGTPVPSSDFFLEALTANKKVMFPPPIFDLINATFIGLDNGYDPVTSAEGSGGVYLMPDSTGHGFVSIFKPIDEEPKAVNNPHGLPLSLDGEGLKRGTRVGEGAFREVAAYLLDHPKNGRRSVSGEEMGFSGAPPPPMSGEVSGAFSSGPLGPPQPPPHPSVALGFSKSTFTYDELEAATQGFSQSNLLGQGGFGFVHKGVLPNGKEIAVKSLKSGSGQGEREFQAEVEIISRVHHRHLVSLVGYCIAGGQRMLVYEFVPNNTLEFHLHGRGQPVMDFESRHKIALGSAKGLAYLHEDCHPRIIHRDIKSANILIDYTFEAKVADFGLAKLSSDNYTHVSTRVMGTFGYLAPEYAASGKLTDKSDVFSFGVVLLELITGRRPVNPTGDEDSLVDWARPQFAHVLDEGIFEGLVDPRLENNFNTQEMTRMVACASASIRHSAKRRPKMSQIVRALEGDMSLDALNEGVKPGQSTYMGGDLASYQQDMQNFRRALDSEEYSSSGYGTSNEYAQNTSRNYA